MTETIPEDLMQAARKTLREVKAAKDARTNASAVIARALMAQRTRQEERVRVLEEALRPFAMTAASDEEIAAMQQEIVDGVMAVVFAATAGRSDERPRSPWQWRR